MILDLEPHEVQVLINALAKEPWHVAHPVMARVIPQVEAQQRPPQEPPSP
jgi:hypothetical protein